VTTEDGLARYSIFKIMDQLMKEIPFEKFPAVVYKTSDGRGIWTARPAACCSIDVPYESFVCGMTGKKRASGRKGFTFM
jgi:hypothetical protein